jgi:hypothetical protein
MQRFQSSLEQYINPKSEVRKLVHFDFFIHESRSLLYFVALVVLWSLLLGKRVKQLLLPMLLFMVNQLVQGH